MATITDTHLAAGAVVAKLQAVPGQSGLRLTLEIEPSRAKGPSRQAFEMYPISLEVDAAKLRTLRFTQEELAEIGFGLLSRLSTLVKHDA